MNTDELQRRLTGIKNALENSHPIETVTVREFIGWFNSSRRGYMATYRIRQQLAGHGICTIPDFDGVHIDSRISFAIASEAEQSEVENLSSQSTETQLHPKNSLVESPILIAGALPEPAFRVSRLLAASTKPLSISPDASLQEAVTLMLRHNYSQLPVMTNDREVKGIISWKGIGAKLSLRVERPQFVRDFMVPHNEVNSSDSLFRVITSIVEHSYVLVRGVDKTIVGIITSTDLSLQFQQLSEPFLLLAEIENHIRKLIEGKFTAEELSSVRDKADLERVIESVADLTFGEYIRLLENDGKWQKARIPVDRKIFVQELDKVRRIRNDVMHFDPDGITYDDHLSLRNFVLFLHEIRRLSS